MSTSTFDSTKDHLHDLLQKAQLGEAQLPDFQRGWVWQAQAGRNVAIAPER